MWSKLWLVWIVVIIGLTTMPWQNYAGHSHWDLVHWIPFYRHPFLLSDVLGNVALFLPFGFLFARASPSWSPRGMWIVTLVAAAALSTAIELFQVYCHNRHPSNTDICSNLGGAVFGLILSQAYKTYAVYPNTD